MQRVLVKIRHKVTCLYNIKQKEREKEMKKVFSNFIVRMNKTVFVFATAAVCALGTVSCGGDDDGDEAGGGGSSAGNTESGVIQTPTGGAVRVAKAGGYTFSYNSDGSLASFFDGDVTYNATYNPFTLSSHYQSSGFEENISYVLSQNKNGYISAMSASGAYTSTEEKEISKGNGSFSYDGSGHLTRVVFKGSGSIEEDGQKYNYTSKSDYTFTWDGGKLVKAVYNFVEGDETESTVVEYTYGSDAVQNVTCQYVPAIIDDDMIAAFFYLGYYGKGPSVLPTSCKVTDTDDEETHVQTYSCTYTLNSDGTVNTFNGIENGTMIYDNMTASGSETAAKSVMMNNKHAKGLHTNFFKRIRK